MAARAARREGLSLQRLLELGVITPRDPVTLRDRLRASASPLPARKSLERGSDWSFVDTLLQSVDAVLQSPAESAGVVELLFDSPGVAIGKRDGGRSEVLHAVLVETNLGDSLAVLRMVVRNDKPPVIEEASIELDLVEWETEEHLAQLVELLAGWHDEYGVRELVPATHGPEAWLCLGYAPAYFANVPRDWDRAMTRIGRVLGLKTYAAASPAEVKSQAILDQIDLAVSVVAAPGDWSAITGELEGRGVAVSPCHDPSHDATQLVRQIIGVLIRAISVAQADTDGKRELRPGEIVYHRKETPQPLEWDRFVEAKKCAHSESAYFRPHTADKAVKGMERLYSNFRADMLEMCGRYPNCHVYRVKDRRQKPADAEY